MRGQTRNKQQPAEITGKSIQIEFCAVAIGVWIGARRTYVDLCQSGISVIGTIQQDPTYRGCLVGSVVHGLEYGAVKVKSTKSARTPDS